MAADILVYRATHVPVGEDQKQHLELTRDIAQKFNNDFGPTRSRRHGFGDAFFPLTEPLIQGPATRIMSLRDGSKKMSKSDPSDYSRINLTDDADTIAQKIRKAKTDPEPLPSEAKGLEGRPEAENLVAIYAALTDTTWTGARASIGGAHSPPSRRPWSTWRSASSRRSPTRCGGSWPIPAYIDSVLADGAERARAIAGRTMDARQGHRRVRAGALRSSARADGLAR